MVQELTGSMETNIEVIHPTITRGRIRFALFDFDGTLSLIREGWQDIMISMMVDILEEIPNHEDRSILKEVVTEFVTQLTGKQTIYQMMRLCDEISLRGGKPEEPWAYKAIYNDKLNEHIKHRISGLRNGQINPNEMTVPGAVEWLDFLKERGVHCFLASGTDEKYVQAEAKLLHLNRYFDEIYGAIDDLKKYSKKMVINRIISENYLAGPEFIAFGDGFVEIEESKSVGGIAVGVASNERTRQGVDEWKRSRLIAAGADLIIENFTCAPSLEAFLFDADQDFTSNKIQDDGFSQT